MAQDRTVTGRGFTIIHRGGSVMKEVEKAILDGLNQAGSAYYQAVMKNTGLSDHDLDDLKELGSPYGTRTGADPIHDDDRMVHIQSGSLQAGIQVTRAEQEGSGVYKVHVTSDAPYTDFLLNGTSKMRPRRFDEKSYEDIGKDNIFDPMRQKLRDLRYTIR